jgi:prevent-host-death family protein
MRMITATEANRDFSKLLERVEKGEAVGITKHGVVIATMNPAKDDMKEREALRQEFLAELTKRKPIPGLQRGTRDELYADLFP